MALSQVSAQAATSTYPTYSVSSPTRFGLGIATTNNIDFGVTSLTGWVDLNNSTGIQMYFTIPQTSPFQIGFAGIIKHTMVENMNIGLHIGGGIGLADVPVGGAGKFGFALNGIGGVHFPFPGASNTRIDLDAGPSFRVVDGNSNFSVGAVSAALGLSVLYFF